MNDAETPCIFTSLQSLNVPWRENEISDILNLYYYGNHSGDKIISPIVEKMLGENEKLSNEDIVSLASIAFNIFGDNWYRLWAVNEIEYNPANNYDMTEHYEDSITDEYGKTVTRTDDLTHGKTGTDTETPNTTETQTPNLNEVSQRNVFGFNDASSGDGQPSEKVVTDNSGTNTTTRTGSNQVEYNTTEKDTGTQSHVDGGQDKRTSIHDLKRSGNIGVTTTQQMLQSEIELWKWDFFNSVVFPDLDRVLTIQTY